MLRGVEQYRPLKDQNKYNQIWKEELTRRAKGQLKNMPIVYESKPELVAYVLQRIKAGECIRSLDLYGHGKPGFISLGNSQGDDLRHSTFIDIARPDRSHQEEWIAELTHLKGFFCDAKSLVSLHACHAGANDEGANLVYSLAKILNATVRAPIDFAYAPIDYGGEWQTASPDLRQPPKAKQPRDFWLHFFSRQGYH